MIRLILIVMQIAIIAGCSNYKVRQYSVAAGNTVALNLLHGKSVNVGEFTDVTPDQEIRHGNTLSCRGIGIVRTMDGNPFSEYIRNALVEELSIAKIYSPIAPVTLNGNLDDITFFSLTGTWHITLTISSSNGKSMTVKEEYPYKTNWTAINACRWTAQAFAPAVQDLISKIVNSQGFAVLITK